MSSRFLVLPVCVIALLMGSVALQAADAAKVITRQAQLYNITSDELMRDLPSHHVAGVDNISPVGADGILVTGSDAMAVLLAVGGVRLVDRAAAHNVTKLISLKYITARDIENGLGDEWRAGFDMVGDGLATKVPHGIGEITPLHGLNALLVTGRDAESIEQCEQVVKQLDVPAATAVLHFMLAKTRLDTAAELGFDRRWWTMNPEPQPIHVSGEMMGKLNAAEASGTLSRVYPEPVTVRNQGAQFVRIPWQIPFLRIERASVAPDGNVTLSVATVWPGREPQHLTVRSSSIVLHLKKGDGAFIPYPLDAGEALRSNGSRGVAALLISVDDVIPATEEP